jgi:hypothetical protein
MPHITLDVSHSLGQEEAVRRIKDKLAAARTEHQSRLSHFHEEWRDHGFAFAFQAMGMSVRGNVAIEDARVKMDADLPLAAALFRGAIESRLRREIDELLGS